MRVGRMRHLVTIQQDSGTTNAAGQIAESWGTFKRVYVELTPLDGSEQIANGQTQGFDTFRVTCQYIDGVTSKMRLLFGSRVLHIASVNIDGEKRRKLVMLCREVS